MSWLSAVTGKAEDFLNKLDRSAADALTPEFTGRGKAPPPHPVTLHHDHEHQASKQSYTPTSIPAPGASAHSHSHGISKLGQSATAPAPKRTLKPAAASVVSATTTRRTSGDSGLGSVKKQSSGGSSSSSSNAPAPASDEALFDFLNSKDPLEGKRKRGAPPVSISQQSGQGVSESSHGDGVKVSPSASAQPQPQHTTQVSAWKKTPWSMTDQPGDDLTHTAAAESDGAELSEPGPRSSPTHSHESADPDALADAMKESPPASLSSGGGELEPLQLDGEDRLSALELENGLLKNEVASLNQEITSLIQHAKKAQTELVRTKEKLTEHSSSASLQEQLVQEVQGREQDLQEALRAKDSQLAVLRLQLEEADRKTASLTSQLTSLATERDRLVQAGDGGQSQAVDSLKLKLSDLESLLTRERHNHTQYQREATERQSRMEQEERALADAVTAAEKRVTEEKAKAAEASSQCRTVRAMLESTRQEMAEYKEKASRILQSKDRLITSLRDGSEASGSVEGGGVSSLEYLSLQQERDMLREELNKARAAQETSHAELQELEGQLHQEGEEAQDRIRSLESQLAEQQQQCTEIEHELHLQKQDLQYTLDDLQRQKGNFQSRLSDREAEIEKLRGQLTTKSLSSTSESELESRVRSLTESLIQKQTMLESLSTENNSLTLQLERLGQQYRDAEHTLMRSAVDSHRSGVADDDSRQRLPTFMREGVTDTEVTRKVKHYVNTIDKFSIRLGVFLRRYPAARVFVLIYMLLLHLWVMVVLATHQQEIHS